MAITFQPIHVDSAYDRDGLLVLKDGALTAVMVRLGDSYDDPTLANCWYVEVSFANQEANGLIFKTTHMAAQWFEAHHAYGVNPASEVAAPVTVRAA